MSNDKYIMKQDENGQLIDNISPSLVILRDLLKLKRRDIKKAADDDAYNFDEVQLSGSDKQKKIYNRQRRKSDRHAVESLNRQQIHKAAIEAAKKGDSEAFETLLREDMNNSPVLDFAGAISGGLPGLLAYGLNKGIKSSSGGRTASWGEWLYSGDNPVIRTIAEMSNPGYFYGVREMNPTEYKAGSLYGLTLDEAKNPAIVKKLLTNELESTLKHTTKNPPEVTKVVSHVPIKEDNFYRSVGQSGIDDALASGFVRPETYDHFLKRTNYSNEGFNFDRYFSKAMHNKGIPFLDPALYKGTFVTNDPALNFSKINHKGHKRIYVPTFEQNRLGAYDLYRPLNIGDNNTLFTRTILDDPVFPKVIEYTPKKPKAAYTLFERPSFLSEAEKAGIPKGERNQLSNSGKNILDHMDLMK